MRDFVLPLHPEGLLSCDDLDHYQVEKENAPPIPSLSDKQQAALLLEIDKKLAVSPTLLCDQSTFDTLYFCVSQYEQLGAAVRDQLCAMVVERAVCLLSLVGGEKKRKRSNEAVLHRNAIKMYSFLLCWLVTIGEKGSKQQVSQSKGRAPAKKAARATEESWDATTKEKVVSALVQTLEGDVCSAWDSGEPEKDWLQLFMKAAGAILENAANLKVTAVRAGTWRLLGLLASRYNCTTEVASLVLRLASKFEHFTLPAVELVNSLSTNYHYPAVVSALFKEVADMCNGDVALSTEGARNIATLLCGISEGQPHYAHQNLHLLLPLLDVEPYPLRNGIVLAIGRILHLAFRDIDLVVSSASFHSNNDVEKTNENREGDQQVLTNQELWEIMEKRFRDVSSYTRSKLIQSWIYLCEHKALPLDRQAIAVSHASERLKDKAVQVRKNAIRMLTALVQNNPFSPVLHLPTLLKALPHHAREKYLLMTDETHTPRLSTEETRDKRADCLDSEEIREQTREPKTRIEHAVEFAIGIKKCLPIIAQLLLSPNSTEAVEAIRFFVCAQQFAIEDAQIGVRKMIEMVWSKEAGVKQALHESFHELYLTAPPVKGKGNANVGDLYVACKLISLTLSATLAELASLEELLIELQQQGFIPSTVVSTLVRIFGAAPPTCLRIHGVGAFSYLSHACKDLRVPKVSAVESRGAIIVLGMLAGASPDIALKNFDLLIATGLGPRAKEDYLFAQYTCIALQMVCAKRRQRDEGTSSLTEATKCETNNTKGKRLTSKKQQADKTDGRSSSFEKLPSEHSLFARLYDLLATKPHNIGRWFGLAEQAINTIYSLAQAPDEICATVIKDLAKLLPTSGGDTEETPCASDVLGRLLFVLGHVSLKQLIHMELAQAEIQRRRQGTPTRSVDVRTRKEQESIELELGVGMAGDEEGEIAYIQHLLEKEVVVSNLLGAFVPLILNICARGSSDDLVKECAILALCKYMCVSSSFCEQNLQLLFSLLSPHTSTCDEESQRLRANIVIAVGDLAFRFPNLLEPWTKHIYQPLSDKSLKVKRNAVMVLTHLILNDMIKVKAYIADLVLCVHDPDPIIARMSRTFFHELAQKGAAIYNVIPDVLSRLSADGTVSSEMFKKAMRHLLSLIEKEKQSESLMEKLCHRLHTAKDEEQEDIAYCLTLLNYSEKSLRRLVELEKCYSAALANPDVLNHFYAIVGKGRRLGSKGEQRAAADDLEKRLDEISAKLAGETGSLDEEEAVAKKKESEESSSAEEEKPVLPKRKAKAPQRTARYASKKAMARTRTTRKAKAVPGRGKGRPCDHDDDSADNHDSDDEEATM